MERDTERGASIFIKTVAADELLIPSLEMLRMVHLAPQELVGTLQSLILGSVGYIDDLCECMIVYEQGKVLGQ